MSDRYDFLLQTIFSALFHPWILTEMGQENLPKKRRKLFKKK